MEENLLGEGVMVVADYSEQANEDAVIWLLVEIPSLGAMVLFEHLVKRVKHDGHEFTLVHAITGLREHVKKYDNQYQEALNVSIYESISGSLRYTIILIYSPFNT